MGKSYRKTPIFGNANSSEKEDKRLANRKFRRIVNERLSAVDANDAEGAELDLQALPNDLAEVSDVWNFSKDGKRYWNPDATLEEHNEKHWRSNQTDVTLHKKMMRK